MSEMRLRLVPDAIKTTTEKVPESDMPKPLLGQTEAEEWRTVSEFPNYEVSDRGRIRRITYLAQYPQTGPDGGYACVRIYDKGTRYERKVHRLAALAFIPNPNNLPLVNHKDFDRMNPDIENLEWASHRGNFDYSRARHKAAVPRGEKHGLSKLTPPQVHCIRTFARWTHWRQRSIGKRFGITQHSVWMIVQRLTWKHV